MYVKYVARSVIDENFAGNLFHYRRCIRAGLGQAKVFGKAGMKVTIADVRQEAPTMLWKNWWNMGSKEKTFLPLEQI